MTNPHKIKIVAHGIDTDGIVSHALLEKLERQANPGCEIEHHYVDYPNFEETLRAIIQGGLEISKLHIADMNANKRIIDLLHFLKKRKVRCSYIDHHMGSINSQGILSGYCNTVLINGDYCTSQLIAESLSGSSDYLARYLGKVAQAHDFSIP